jgi:hypothetical protein
VTLASWVNRFVSTATVSRHPAIKTSFLIATAAATLAIKLASVML